MDRELLIPIIKQSAKEASIDPLLVAAFIQQESNWNPWAIRFEKKFYEKFVLQQPNATLQKWNPFLKTGVPTIETERWLLGSSFGLMQIMGLTARENGFHGQYLSELCNPLTGIQFGIRYLKTKLDIYEGDDAIAAYNAGSPILQSGKTAYINQKYVDDVKAKYEQLKKEDFFK